MAPAAAVPVAATPTRYRILKVGIPVVLAHDLPRERRANPSKQFHRNSTKPPGPCRQERTSSLLSASPLPRLHQRGHFPHTIKDQSQLARCPGPLPGIASTPYLESGAR